MLAAPTVVGAFTLWKMANLQIKRPVPQSESHSLNVYQHTTDVYQRSTAQLFPEAVSLRIRVCLFLFLLDAPKVAVPPSTPT